MSRLGAGRSANQRANRAANLPGLVKSLRMRATSMCSSKRFIKSAGLKLHQPT